jgi:hypothetical protein
MFEKQGGWANLRPSSPLTILAKLNYLGNAALSIPCGLVSCCRNAKGSVLYCRDIF